jgi:hypothetical protein
MCSSGSKNPRFFGGPRALTGGVVIRISLMRYTTVLKNVRGILHHTPLSAYGRKESRPRTERPSHDSCEVCGFVCGIAAYEGAVEKGQRHNDTRERARVDARAPNPARHLKDTYVPSDN